MGTRTTFHRTLSLDCSLGGAGAFALDFTGGPLEAKEAGSPGERIKMEVWTGKRASVPFRLCSVGNRTTIGVIGRRKWWQGGSRVGEGGRGLCSGYVSGEWRLY